MPELPEVETIARTLTPLVQDKRVTNVRVLLPRSVDTGSLPLESLCGRRFTGAGRRGKLALLKFEPERGSADEAHMLGVHLKMTGRLFVYPEDTPPTPHTRVAFGLEDAQGRREQLFFDDARTFGYMRLVSPATLPQWAFWQKLGLEPLETPVPTLAQCLRTTGRAVKAALLDQELVAGIGNIYADEALFRAGIDPRTPAKKLSHAQGEKLFSCVAEVLRESIEQCGSSIRDYRTARGDAGAFQNYFRVYGRSGQQCYVCGTALVSCKVAGRTTVLCPQCQHVAG